MSRLNEEFLEIYKSIEAFCRDTYKADKGVTSYIDEMSQIVGASWSVPGWDETLSKLKNYRYIRNSYTHDVGTSYTDICTQEDIEWLQGFYDKLMHAQDPISLYVNKKQASSRPVSSQYIQSTKSNFQEENVYYNREAPPTSYRQTEPQKSRKGCLIFFLVFIAVIVLIVLLIISLFGLVYFLL